MRTHHKQYIMDNNSKYFVENEDLDLKKLEELNAKAHLFTEITPSKVKHYTDATGYTVNGLGEIRYFNIELKNRNQVLLQDGRISGCSQTGKEYIDETIFIEDHKIADMLLDTINGLEPLYINFLSNGWVLIYNLSKLTQRPKKYVNMRINSKGYKALEFGNRQGLYIKDAAIFDSNYNLIKKAGEDFI